MQSPFSDWEDAVIIKSHLRYGNKWSHISKLIPGRTDNAVKNRWNCKLKRRLAAGAVKGYYSTSSLTLEQVLKAAGKPPPDPGQIPSHQTYPPHAWALPQSSADGFQAIIIPNSTGAFLGQPFALAHITSLAGVSVALPATRSQLLGIHRVHSAPHIAGQAQGHVVSAPFVVATTQAAEWPQLPPAVVTRLQQPALQQYRYPVLSADAVIPEHGHGTWQPKNVAAASTLPQQPGLQQLERAGLSAGLALQQQTLSASLPPQQLTPPPSDTAPRSVEIPSLQPTGNKESAMLKAPALIPSPEAEPRLDCCEVQDDLLELLSSSPLPAAADSAHSFSNLNTLPSGKILCESIDVIDMSMPSEACLDEEALIHGIWPVDLLDSQDMEVDDFHERPSASLTSEDSSTLSFLFQ